MVPGTESNLEPKLLILCYKFFSGQKGTTLKTIKINDNLSYRGFRQYFYFFT